MYRLVISLFNLDMGFPGKADDNTVLVHDWLIAAIYIVLLHEASLDPFNKIEEREGIKETQRKDATRANEIVD